MPDIFLSYSREDQAVARRFAEAFEGQGFNVWWDTALKSGEAYDQVTEKALREARAVVVLWSKRSVESRWVRAEATLADRNKTLVPAMIEACERPIMFELTQTADLSHWQGDQKDRPWQAFVDDVRRFIAAHSAAKKPTAPAAATPAAPPPAPQGRGTRPSLAVMPFTNRSGERADDIFADGMVEDLISALSLSRAARIIASGAVRSLRNQAGDLRAIGRELGARYILEGNVRRVATNLRVTAQLVEAETGAILWTDKYDRPLAELALLQEDLITHVASQIGVQVQRLEMERVLKKPDNLTAWEAVMRSFSAYGRLGPQTIPVAIQEARRAIELAPDYGVAHGVLALALSTAYLYTFRQGVELRREAIEHAERALDLAPHDPNVLWTVSWAFTSAERIDAGLACGERAVAANPNNVNARNAFAQVLIAHNRPEEALEHLDEAERIAPRGFNYYISLGNRGLALRMAGRFDEALAALDRALQLSPNYAPALSAKTHLFAKLGRWDEAMEIVRRLQSLYPQVTRELDLLGSTGPLIGRLAEENIVLVNQMWDRLG
jgi:TolB-like protein/Tfp pilus assembly protein PilF